MNKIYNLSCIILLALIAFSCSEDKPIPTNVNSISFGDANYSFGVTVDGQKTNDVKVYTGRKTSNDRTFNLTVIDSLTTALDGSYEIPQSVTIPANSNEGVIPVTISDMNIGDGKEIVLKIETTDDIAFSPGNLVINVFLECSEGESKAEVNIEFDNWPEEIYWVITNSNNEEVAASMSPANYGAYDGLTGAITERSCLSPGVYTFSIYDAYGDGAGPVNVTVNGNIVFSSDGSYDDGTSGTFTVE